MAGESLQLFDAVVGQGEETPHDFDELLLNISARFVRIDSAALDAEIAVAQGQICQLLKLERASLWLESPGSPGKIALVQFQGQPLRIGIPLQTDFGSLYPWATQRVLGGATVVLNSVADIPASATVDRESFNRAGLKSVLMIPMMSGEVAMGILDFGTVNRRWEWPARIVARCQLVAQVFASALVRQRLEQSHRDSEARFRAVIETSQDGTIFSDENGTILYRSSNFWRLTGFDDADRVGRNGFELIHPDDVNETLLIWRRVLAEPEVTHRMCYRAMHKDGGYRWLEATARNLLANPSVRAIVTSSRDITDRQKLEGILRRYESLARYTRDIVLFMRHSDGRLLDANAAAVKAYGYPLETLQNMTIAELRSPQAPGDLRQLLDEASAVGKQFESVHRRQDGSVFPVEVMSVGMSMGSERILMSIIRDISRRRHAEEQSREQQGRLAHLSRIASVGEMASGLAHELNQPLTAILNYSAACNSLLDKIPAVPARLHEAVNGLALEAKRAGEIVRRWRSFIRDRNLEKQPWELNELILHESIELLLHDLRRAEVKLTTERSSAPMLVLVDPVLIQQVVVNLIQNSIDAMVATPPVLRCLEIRIGEPVPGMARVEFKDSGSGVAKAQRGSLFRAFFSTKPQGLGLGLSISRSIVESHGGRLEYFDNPSEGSTFWFSLPLES